MDGYLPNTCEYCGKIFDNIRNLVLHIEALHIEFDVDEDNLKKELNDDDAQEDWPTKGIPLSLILPYGTPDEHAEVRQQEVENLLMAEQKQLLDAASAVYQSCSSQALTTSNKKFACPVPGCNKSYKNQNGMKYHVINFHEINRDLIKTVKPKKEFKCVYCKKQYKTSRGLQTHVLGHEQQLGIAGPSSLMVRHQQVHYSTVDSSSDDTSDGVFYLGNLFQVMSPSASTSTNRHEAEPTRRNPYLNYDDSDNSQLILEQQQRNLATLSLLRQMARERSPDTQRPSRHEENSED